MGPEEVLKTEDRYPSLILNEDNAEILNTRIDNVNCRNDTIDDERNTVSDNKFSVNYSKRDTAKCRKCK